MGARGARTRSPRRRGRARQVRRYRRHVGLLSPAWRARETCRDCRSTERVPEPRTAHPSRHPPGRAYLGSMAVTRPTAAWRPARAPSRPRGPRHAALETGRRGRPGTGRSVRIYCDGGAAGNRTPVREASGLPSFTCVVVLTQTTGSADSAATYLPLISTVLSGAPSHVQALVVSTRRVPGRSPHWMFQRLLGRQSDCVVVRNYDVPLDEAVQAPPTRRQAFRPHVETDRPRVETGAAARKQPHRESTASACETPPLLASGALGRVPRAGRRAPAATAAR